MKNYIKLSTIIVLLTALDLLTKAWATRALSNPIHIIESVFSLRYAENYGIAFSINIPPTAIIIANILLLVVLAYIAIKELNLNKCLSRILTGLVAAGGFGNLIDRIINGYVVDFISIGRYPLFNLADIYITVAVFSILLFYGKIKKENKNKPK